MSEDLIRRSDAIDALGEEPYVWTDDDEFAMGERSQWIDDVSAIRAVSSVDTSEAKEYILSELLDLLEEYSELDENGLHDPKWCGVSEAYGIVKNVPFIDRPQLAKYIVEPVINGNVIMSEDTYEDLLDRPQGEWIDKGWKGDWQFETDGRGCCWKVFECSLCNGENTIKTRFCPHCGARMKGVDDE